MDLDELLDRPCAWFTDHESSDIAISSRIRLARNIAGQPFPSMANAEKRVELRTQVLSVMADVDAFKDGWSSALEPLSVQQRSLLFERSLISSDHAEVDQGAGVAVSGDEREVVMINEEDHLLLQVMEGGLQLGRAWKTIEALDDRVEDQINYAFDERYGYLTACPSNTGTGMRAGVMLHLPGLAMMEEITPVTKGLNKLGFAVRGIGGEGSEADGFFYQVSNQVTLGRREEEIIHSLEETVSELVTHERNARLRLLESRESWVLDRIGRAYGVAKNAYMLTSKEALDYLGMIRLGLALDLLQNDQKEQFVEKLMLEVRPAHLQRRVGKELQPSERDLLRAARVRSRLAELKKADRLELS